MRVSKGLDGIIAAQSSISSIIGTMLTYRGYKIDDLTERSEFEEVIYLLWHGRLPQIDELNELKKELYELGYLSKEITEAMKIFPKEGKFMDVLRTTISLASLYEKDTESITEEVNLRKAKSLVAKMSSIVVSLYRIRNDLEPIESDPNLSYSANFLYMLSGKVPSDNHVKAFNKALILHADHELNASTFSSRVTVATLSDMYSGVISAMGTLKGPLHGGANEQVMTMLEEISEIDKVEAYLDEKFKNSEKIMGMGHRVYKQGDPRTKHLKKISYQLALLDGDTKWYNLSEKIEDYVYNRKKILPNVDFYSATVYFYLGIPKELFTPIFAISRTSGWTAHIMEQYKNNKIIRPRSEYTGNLDSKYISIDER
ncbi:MAG: citrate/2-methylcitrate synthase [Vulcanibacillus sp.]